MKRIATAAALSFALAAPMWGGVQASAPPEARVGYMLASYVGMDERERSMVAGLSGAAAVWRGARIGAAIGGMFGGFAGVVVGAAVGAG